MELEPAEYRKLAIKQFPARTLRETAEGRYWKQFRAAQTSQQIGAVTHIDFCEAYPHNYAVTSSTRVLLCDGRGQTGRQRQLTRFKDRAYSGCYRADGQLLVAGGESGLVQVFQTNSRAVLRQLKAHQRPVHVARFSPDKLHVLSGSDDATVRGSCPAERETWSPLQVRFWDVTQGQQVSRLTGHTDYVRAGAVSPLDMNVWATGGYDHVCKIWDVRSKAATLSLDHGAPIEALTYFPSGAMVATAGGNHVCVWDVLGGGRLLARLSNHQKTVTSLAVSPLAGPASSAAPRLLTGSLDGHIKIFELDQFKVTHAISYPGPVLSMGISPDCSTLAAGLATGLLAVKRHAKPPVAGAARTAGAVAGSARARRRAPLTAANYKYFLRGQSAPAGPDDYRVRARRRVKLAPFDRALRKFLYREALDAALGSGKPEVVASVLQELTARSGLNAALGGRDAESLEPLIAFIAKYIVEPRHAKQLTGVAHRLLDLYGTAVGETPALQHLLTILQERVAVELRTQSALIRLMGMVEPIVASAS